MAANWSRSLSAQVPQCTVLSAQVEATTQWRCRTYLDHSTQEGGCDRPVIISVTRLVATVGSGAYYPTSVSHHQQQNMSSLNNTTLEDKQQI